MGNVHLSPEAETYSAKRAEGNNRMQRRLGFFTLPVKKRPSAKVFWSGNNSSHTRF
jgi:hypothetical protein